MIWQVDMNNLQVNIKIWQVDIIIWQVMADICDHRCQTDINMSFCLLTLKIINAKHIISYIVTVYYNKTCTGDKTTSCIIWVSFLSRCLFLYLSIHSLILFDWVSILEICRQFFLRALLYCHMISKHGNFWIIFHTFYPQCLF